MMIFITFVINILLIAKYSDNTGMKIKLFIMSVLMSVCLGLRANAESYFQYPIVPDSVATFQGRCNYLADHFWDFCEMSKAFSAKQKMAEELKVFLSVMANAEPEAAKNGVRKLMTKLEKQPKDQLFMATVAEGHLFGDTADVWIDELYLPFAEAIANNKRISKAEKARFVNQAEVLRNSMVGVRAPSLPYTLRDGSQGNLQADSAQVVVLFFNDPDCSDCNMARLRLDADISMNELIKDGLVKVVAISLCEPDEEWRSAVERFPDTWRVGASPDADLTIDLRNGPPDFYLLGRDGTIRYKHLNVDQVLDVARQLKKR